MTTFAKLDLHNTLSSPIVLSSSNSVSDNNEKSDFEESDSDYL